LANIKSQKKRNRQNEKRRVKNSQVKSSIRTINKSVLKTITAKEEKNVEKAQELLQKFIKNIDTAAGKGIIHKKKAARKKSRLTKQVNSFAK